MTKTKFCVSVFMLLFLTFETANAQTTWDIGYPNATDITATLSNDTLYVQGVGKMMDFTSYNGSNASPWLGDNNITTIIVEYGITRIGDYFFTGTKQLAEVSLPNTITSIGYGAFSATNDYPNNLTSIDLPENLDSIGQFAFNNCPLNNITIPENVTYIGFCAFQLTALSSVTIPANVISSLDMVFSSCANLSSINVDFDNPRYISLDGILYTKQMDTLVNYPMGITNQTFTIPNSVTQISVWFGIHNSYLTSLTIPDNFNARIVLNTAGSMFYSAPNVLVTNLTSIINLSSIPSELIVAENPAEDGIANDTLYVPCGSLTAYQAASGWQDFGTIIEMCSLPGISNTQANFSCPGQVTVTYDLNTDCETDVILYYSHNKRDWLPAAAVTGDLTAQTAGTGKTIIWNNYADNVRYGKFYFKVEAGDCDYVDTCGCNGVPAPMQIGGNIYLTHLYMTDGEMRCWMVENLKEAPAGAAADPAGAVSASAPQYWTTYPGQSAGERGFYYNHPAALLACPDGWYLPAQAELIGTNGTGTNGIYTTLNNPATLGRGLWNNAASFAGERATAGTWLVWGYNGYWWSSTSGSYLNVTTSGAFSRWGWEGDVAHGAYGLSVRCIQNK